MYLLRVAVMTLRKEGIDASLDSVREAFHAAINDRCGEAWIETKTALAALVADGWTRASNSYPSPRYVEASSVEALVQRLDEVTRQLDECKHDGPRHERPHATDPDAPQWERQWCVVDNEDWPCAFEQRRRSGASLIYCDRKDLRQALQAERDTSEGNPYSPAKAADFVYLWLWEHRG